MPRGAGVEVPASSMLMLGAACMDHCPAAAYTFTWNLYQSMPGTDDWQWIDAGEKIKGKVKL